MAARVSTRTRDRSHFDTGIRPEAGMPARSPSRKVVSIKAFPGPTDQPKDLRLPEWAEWAFVETDGGVTLLLYPGESSSTPVRVSSGSLVFLEGEGAAYLSHAGIAPGVSPVIIGSTQADALLYAASGHATAATSGGSGAAPNKTGAENIDAAGAYIDQLPAGYFS